MEVLIIVDRLCFFLYSVKEKFWVKFFGFCLFLIFVVFVVKVVDGILLVEYIFEIKFELVEILFLIMVFSMMVIVIFFVGIMVNVYVLVS